MTVPTTTKSPEWLPVRPIGFVCPLCNRVYTRLAEFNVNYVGLDDLDGQIEMGKWRRTYMCGACFRRLCEGAKDGGWFDAEPTGRILPEHG
jgi:hypothetical protein